MERVRGDLQQTRVLFKNEVENVIKEKRDSLEKVYQKCVQEKNLFGEYHIRALAEELDSIYESKENEFIQNNNNIVAASLIYARLFALNKNKMLREKYELLGDSARKHDPWEYSYEIRRKWGRFEEGSFIPGLHLADTARQASIFVFRES